MCGFTNVPSAVHFWEQALLEEAVSGVGDGENGIICCLLSSEHLFKRGPWKQSRIFYKSLCQPSYSCFLLPLGQFLEHVCLLFYCDAMFFIALILYRTRSDLFGGSLTFWTLRHCEIQIYKGFQNTFQTVFFFVCCLSLNTAMYVHVGNIFMFVTCSGWAIFPYEELFIYLTYFFNRES